MDLTNVYSVCWSNHQAHIKTQFDALLDCNEFTDVTLCCEGKKIQAHKLILSACSNYFHEIFKENPCQHPVIILQDIKYENLHNIIKFIYNGEVNVQIENFQSFLKTAQLFNISGFSEESSIATDDEETEECEVKTLPPLKKINRESLQDEECITNSNNTLPADTNCDELGNSIFENNSMVTMQKKGGDVKNRKRKIISKSDNQEIPAAKYVELSLIDSDEESEKVKEITVKTEEESMGLNEEDNMSFENNVDEDHLSDPEKTCNVCGKQFLHRSSLKQHMPSHTGVTECDICGLVLSRKYELKLHLKKRHNIISV